MKCNKKQVLSIGKNIFLDGMAMWSWTAGIVRQWDAIETNAKFKQIKTQIDGLADKVAIIQDSYFEASIAPLLNILEQSGVAEGFNFRKANLCFRMIEKINNDSVEGQENDPIMEFDDCVKVMETGGSKDAITDLKLVSYELEKELLVYRHPDANSPLGFHAVAPRDCFFCKTDKLFQKWDPENDAKKIIKKLILENEETEHLSKIDEIFGWGPRRLNSAIAYMYYNGLIYNEHELGGIRYVLPYIRLSEEAFLIKTE